VTWLIGRFVYIPGCVEIDLILLEDFAFRLMYAAWQITADSAALIH
jgi:hypothetical protein